MTVAVALSSFALLAACGDDGTGPAGAALAGVGVANALDTLGIADTLRLVAVARDSSDAPVDASITWRSLAPMIATIGGSGLLTGVDSGDVRVVVTARARTTVEDTILVRVRALPHAFALSGLAATISLGSRDTIAAEVRDGRGDVLTAPVRWGTSNGWVLSVDSVSGIVIARAAGTAWVRASAGRVQDSVRVEVPVVPLMPGHAWMQVAGHTLSATPRATCALETTGQVWCEGPAGAEPLPGATRLRELQGGQAQFCGLDAEGRVHCVGTNGTRVFGADVPPLLRSDSLVAGGDGRRFIRYVLGDHQQACGIQAADSVVYCWGHNDNGQVGRLPLASEDAAVAPITGDLKATQVDLTGFSGCALALDTSVWCWGSPSYFGGTGFDYLPQQVQPPGRFSSIATADLAVCGLSVDGAASCWGAWVGDGTPAASPRALDGTLRFTRIVARDFGTQFCGVTAAGALHCWNTLGDASLPAMTPVAVLPGRTVTSVSLARYRRCAVVTGGDAFCF